MKHLSKGCQKRETSPGCPGNYLCPEPLIFPKKQPTQNHAKGFTLIETMFSLLLLSMVLVIISKMISYGMEAHRKSSIRFYMSQELEMCMNRLIAQPFDSTKLKAGTYQSLRRPYRLKWEIIDLTPELKYIRFVILYKTLIRQAYIFKSKYIKNNEKDTK